jgi:hypothetical protein
MPTTELFVVDSAGVAKKVSKLSAQFYRYKKQIAAGKMDPSSVSVNSSHPAVTAARRQRGKAAMARETPPTRTSRVNWRRRLHPAPPPPPLVALDWLAAVPRHWLVLPWLAVLAAWDRKVLLEVF